mgnify:CR=1 FL=1
MVFDASARRGMWLLLGLMAAGCGFNLGDVDRTQPYKVKKSIFADGKPWYFRQTVIDLPSTSDVSFIGEQGGTHKIIWRIDEDFLYAYRSFEQLKGGEQYAQRPGVPYLGTPTAAFRIQSHFDVQREYNPQTGEELNVVNENQSGTITLSHESSSSTAANRIRSQTGTDIVLQVDGGQVWLSYSSAVSRWRA